MNHPALNLSHLKTAMCMYVPYVDVHHVMVPNVHFFTSSLGRRAQPSPGRSSHLISALPPVGKNDAAPPLQDASILGWVGAATGPRRRNDIPSRFLFFRQNSLKVGTHLRTEPVGT